MKIVYIKNKYPEKRNIINKIKESGYSYEEKNVVKSLRYLLGRLICKIFKISNWNIDGIYRDLDTSLSNTFIHTFNAICFTKNQWCVTYESVVPRVGETVERVWEQGEELKPNSIKKIQTLCNHMLAPNCRQIIALSQSAYYLQKNMLETLHIVNRDELMKKTVVLYPPQEILITDVEIDCKFKNLDVIHFIFVANGFFLKAGKEIIDAFVELRAKYNIHLTVVSNFSHVNGYETKKELRRYEKKIRELDWIEVYTDVSNQDVLCLCKKAHIGLLPSYQETFGYSLLEMQASGTPVITTNIRAFPELNNEKCGWVIDLHIDEYGETKRLSRNLQKENKKLVYEGLLQYVDEIFADKELVCKKAYASVERIKKSHSVEVYSEKLKKIYS